MSSRNRLHILNSTVKLNENHNLHYSFVENDEDKDVVLVLLLEECGEQMFA